MSSSRVNIRRQRMVQNVMNRALVALGLVLGQAMLEEVARMAGQGEFDPKGGAPAEQLFSAIEEREPRVMDENVERRTTRNLREARSSARRSRPAPEQGAEEEKGSEPSPAPEAEGGAPEFATPPSPEGPQEPQMPGAGEAPPAEDAGMMPGSQEQAPAQGVPAEQASAGSRGNGARAPEGAEKKPAPAIPRAPEADQEGKPETEPTDEEAPAETEPGEEPGDEEGQGDEEQPSEEEGEEGEEEPGAEEEPSEEEEGEGEAGGQEEEGEEQPKEEQEEQEGQEPQEEGGEEEAGEPDEVEQGDEGATKKKLDASKSDSKEDAGKKKSAGKAVGELEDIAEEDIEAAKEAALREEIYAPLIEAAFVPPTSIFATIGLDAVWGFSKLEWNIPWVGKAPAPDLKYKLIIIALNVLWGIIFLVLAAIIWAFVAAIQKVFDIPIIGWLAEKFIGLFF